MRLKEIVTGTLATITLLELSTACFSSKTKKIKRAERTDLPPNTRTEIHHIVPIYRGGRDTIDNAECDTLPEHAMAHLTLAHEAKQRRDRKTNYWAVSQIVRRMLPEEQDEFNKMLSSK